MPRAAKKRTAHSTNWQTRPKKRTAGRAKRQPKFSGTLPDGTTTINAEQYNAAWRVLATPIAKEYIAAWRELATLIVEEFGWKLRAYVPCLSS